MKTTINTNERIFQITTFEGDVYLGNLDSFSIEAGQLLFNGLYIKSIKHYWNNKFERIYKEQVKTLLEINRK